MGTAVSRLIGVGCLLGALYSAQRTLEFRRHGEVVSGTVVAVETRITATREGLDHNERTEVRYTPRAGRRSFVLRSPWNNALFGRYDLGDVVQVRYLPTEPGDAREDSLLLDWLLPLLLIALGAGGLAGRLRTSHNDWEFTLRHDRRE